MRDVRIVSLLPAATDLVAELGLLPSLVGRTHECDWPADVASVPVVTSSEIGADLSSREISAAVASAPHRGSSLYRLDADRLAELAPDIVLTQDLCDVCALSYRRVTTTLRSIDGDAARVLSLEPRTLPEVLACLTDLGDQLGVQERARQAVASATGRLSAVRAAVAGRVRPRVLAIEWLDPLWPAGHWVPDQITAAGGVPLLGSPGEHTSAVPWEAMRATDPDVVLLLPCGLSQQRTRADLPTLTTLPGWPDLPAVRRGEVWLLDGPAYYNRPGPRVVRGAEVLAHVLHGVTVGTPVQPTEATRI